MQEQINLLKQAIRPFRALMALETQVDIITAQLQVAQEKVVRADEADARAAKAKEELETALSSLPGIKEEAANTVARAELVKIGILADAQSTYERVVAEAKELAEKILAEAKQEAAEARKAAGKARVAAEESEAKQAAAEEALASARATIAALKGI